MKKLIILALLLLGCAFTHTTATAAQNKFSIEKKKTIEGMSTFSGIPTLDIKHCYGNIKIIKWAQNQIKMSGEITVRGNNAKDVDAILNAITIDFKSGQTTSITTNIDWPVINKITNNSRNGQKEVNISVWVPEEVYLHVVNKYGNTSIEGSSKTLNAEIKYGNLSVGDISQSSSVIIKYGNLQMGNVAQSLNIDIKYGNFAVASAQKLTLNAKYGSCAVSKADEISISSLQYGSLNIKQANIIRIGELSYSGCVIGDVSKVLNISKLSYGGLSVDEVGANFESVNVTASYSTVRVGVNGSASFQYDLSTSYSDASIVDFGAPSFKEKDYNSSHIRGSVGNNRSASIDIKNSYASIQVFKK